MSRNRSDALTGELFSTIPAALPQTEGSMDLRTPVAQLVSEMLKAAKDSRYIVAARVSELAGHETSKGVLDSYTAESREASNLPLWKAPLIEVACDSRVLAEWHASVLGGRVLWGEQIIDADLGSVDRQIAELQERKKRLKQYQQLGRRRG